MRSFLPLAIVLVIALAAPKANAAPITIDFDSLSELTPVATQFTGLTFSNATVLTAGSTLNEFELPPFSGSNVIFDDGGPLSITFSIPTASFAGYFTYLVPVTVSAFDASNDLIASVSSSFLSNLALSGDPGSSPNELLQISFAQGISSVTITGDPVFGGSFTLDNLTYAPISQGPTEPVPAPSTLILSLVGLAGLLAALRVSAR